MAFVARTYEEILSDMITYVQGTTILSDFTIGSVIRSILEAAALEDDEQYFQMIQLLDAFSIITATGQDLDNRLADYNIVREPPRSATCRNIVIADKNLITNQASLDVSAGGLSVSCFSISTFPTSFPFVIRVGERTTRVQDLTVSASNVGTGTFTLASPSLFDIEVGDRVSYVDTTASPKTVNLGTNIQVPPTVGNAAVIFTTKENASVLSGNYFSNAIIAVATIPGVAGNVGANKITQFVSSPPFSGALVTNLSAAGGGRNRERDEEFVQRALAKLQALSRGTPLALKAGALNVTDSLTNQRVTSANLIEDYALDEVNLYIDDGTGLTPDIQNLAQSNLATAAVATDTTLALEDASDFPSAGFILIEVDASNNDIEIAEYTSKLNNTLALTTPLSFNHDVAAIVNYVDILTLAAEQGQRRFRLSNSPIARFSDRVFINQGTGWYRAIAETDYKLNRGTGEFQIIDSTGLASGASVVTNYDFYTNLIASVQKVLEGDPSNPTAFPGYKASGIFLNVEAPILRRITIRASISVEHGYTEADVAPNVIIAMTNYIRTLGIGEDVIRSKLIDAAHNVVGLRDIIIQSPSANIVILENELPVPFDASGNSLVRVS